MHTYTDKQKRTYIASFTGGISQIVSKNLLSNKIEFKTYTTDDGLASDLVQAMQEDQQGNLGFFRKMAFLNSTLKERFSRITGLTLCTRNLASQKRHRWSTLEIKSYSAQTRASLRFLPKRCRKVPMCLPLSLPVWKCRDNLLSSPLTIWKNYASPPLSVMLLSSLRHSIMSIPKKPLRIPTERTGRRVARRGQEPFCQLHQLAERQI